MSSKEIFERWYYFMVIGSKELIRDINSKLVLETIMKEEPISRAAISKRLGLTKATISAKINKLRGGFVCYILVLIWELLQ